VPSERNARLAMLLVNAPIWVAVPVFGSTVTRRRVVGIDVWITAKSTPSLGRAAIACEFVTVKPESVT
jgi:hypothetical protein